MNWFIWCDTTIVPLFEQVNGFTSFWRNSGNCADFIDFIYSKLLAVPQKSW